MPPILPPHGTAGQASSGTRAITVTGARDYETFTIGNDVIDAIGNIQQSYSGSAPFTINML
jgi:hypothetical protein